MSNELDKLCEAINKNQKSDKEPEVSVIGAAILSIGMMIFLFIASFGVGIWVMMSGWGLTPQSWGVIIGGMIMQIIITIVITCIPKIFKN